MVYGYARVSSKGQDLYGNGLDVQERLLKEAGASMIYREAYTGTKSSRPELDKLLSVLQAGDTVVVAKLDRIARSVKAGLDIIDTVADKGCSIRILNLGTFDNTPTGRLMRTMMLGIAEFERDMIVQRTQEGKAVAREKNPDYKEGRKAKRPSEFEEYLRKQRSGLISVDEAVVELGISRTTWYKLCREVA